MKKLIYIIAFILLISPQILATDYYIDPSAGDNADDGLSQADAWATFAYAQGAGGLSAGDTLYLMDGTYTAGTTGVLTVTESGTSGNPITFKGLNSTGVTIDGEGSSVPVSVSAESYVDIEDILATDGSAEVVYVSGSSSYVNIRRVMAHKAAVDNNSVFVASSSSYVLFEDCAAWGRGRKMFLGISSSYITFRRCWGRFESWSGVGGDSPTGLQFYRTTDSLMENCVFVKSASATHDTKSFSSVRVGTNNDNDRNIFYGNIVHGDTGTGGGFRLDGDAGTANLTGHRWYHNVVIETDVTGVYIDVGDDTIIENMTVVGVDNNDTAFFFKRTLSAGGGFSFAATLKNSSLLTGSNGLFVDSDSPGFDSFTNSYINIYDCTTDYEDNASSGTGDTTIDPNYDTATYGYGAYLMASQCDLAGTGEGGTDMGAEVLYQYEDGVLSDVALWPWPMESEILAETGISVTYDSDQGSSETGGIWTTLDGVYSTGLSSRRMIIISQYVNDLISQFYKYN